MKTFFITTAIDYPNSLPHLGTAFEKIGADVQARFQKMKVHPTTNVRFLMGNDENTFKVLKRAEEEKTDPKEYVDVMAAKFKGTWRSLSVCPDRFIQTTDSDHVEFVQDFIRTIHRYDSSLFYKSQYEGLYCDGCEEYKTKTNLIQNNSQLICPNHPQQKLRLSQEENWFFALSRFSDFLRNFHNENPEFIQPEFRRKEILNQIDNLQDVCVTRKMHLWGIPFPLDENFKVYVWFDALLNYLSGSDGFNDAVHVIGKDITRFHCLLYPAMLHAAKKPLPKQVVVHGFITRDGVKEAKTNADASVVLRESIEKFGGDSVRYFLLSRCPFFHDSNYTLDEIRNVYRGELANNLGNLVSRVTTMMSQYFPNGLITSFEKSEANDWIDEAWLREYMSATENYDYVSALKKVWKLLHEANQDIEHVAPWNLFKRGKMDELAQVLTRHFALLRLVSIVISPYMPFVAKKIYNLFSFEKLPNGYQEDVYFEEMCSTSFLKLLATHNYFLVAGIIRLDQDNVKKYLPLFPKVATP